MALSTAGAYGDLTNERHAVRLRRISNSDDVVSKESSWSVYMWRSQVLYSAVISVYGHYFGPLSMFVSQKHETPAW